MDFDDNVDAELVRLARSGGPDSFASRTLANALQEAAVGYLIKLDNQGALFAELHRKGLLLPAPPPGWPQESRSVIHLSVARALVGFMDKQVLKGGWDPRGGASLRTYFINASL